MQQPQRRAQDHHQRPAQDERSWPWLAIVAGAVVIGVAISGIAIAARSRRRRREAIEDWRAHAAQATAEIGSTARSLSAGAPVTADVAQQVLRSLRAFDALARAAPDAALLGAAQRARRVVQTLGIAIDDHHQVRRSQPPQPERLDASAALLRQTAGEADRALRALYRGFTQTG